MSTQRIEWFGTALQFKLKYLSINIPERKILIDEFITYLTEVGDTQSRAWFVNQKILHEVPDEEGRKAEVMSWNVWQMFYSRMMSSFLLRGAVTAFLSCSHA